MTFFAFEIKHEDEKVSKCLINLDHVVQIIFDENVGRIKTVDDYVYNLGKPEIERLLKIMKHQQLITALDFPLTKFKKPDEKFDILSQKMQNITLFYAVYQDMAARLLRDYSGSNEPKNIEHWKKILHNCATAKFNDLTVSEREKYQKQFNYQN